MCRYFVLLYYCGTFYSMFNWNFPFSASVSSRNSFVISIWSFDYLYFQLFFFAPQALRTLFNIAHRLHNVLGPSWVLVCRVTLYLFLKCCSCQLIQWIMAGLGNPSSSRPSNPFTSCHHTGNVCYNMSCSYTSNNIIGEIILLGKRFSSVRASLVYLL